VHVGLPRRLAFRRGEDHHEVFVRAQLSRAPDGDVEAWNERRQAQPIEDADAEIQDSHRTDSRRESPGPILDLGLWSRPPTPGADAPTGGRRFSGRLERPSPIPARLLRTGVRPRRFDRGRGWCGP
jgi:hypothetical protein